jgi:eukaryotic-like serine/threonine-protein kinase
MGDVQNASGAEPTDPVGSIDVPIDFPGGEHYAIVRRIGSGGMGVVYEAVDLRTTDRVALKTLRKFDAVALYRFKQEFRTLADVRHRNLVRLHELVVSAANFPFFTMELVDGVEFLAFLRSERQPPHDWDDDRARGPATGDHVRTTKVSRPTLEKVRPALRQLVDGLQALHEAGKLHRDIKPSNVLVTAAGRVVLLDFGVATDLQMVSGTTGETGTAERVGTPVYMSPEQTLGEVVTGASDLYSVGVMLYEALVGRLPFDGPAVDVMTRKVLLEPTAPCECIEGVPRDLNDLCVALLQIDPDLRPSARDVLRSLGASRRPGPDAPRHGTAALLVGREGEKKALGEAFDAVRGGEAVTVHVKGAGGMGKSALVRSFIDDLIAGAQANVLCGRAYERESVPYKAVDGVVDAMSQLLVQLDEDESPLVPPHHTRALARMFPVLLRARSFGGAADSSEGDLQAERRRAFSALRNCLELLARMRPLVIYIDDVQWGDTDSAALLIEVMRPPHPPALLLVMTSREEEAERSPFLAEMAEGWPTDVRNIQVGPLSAPEAHRLALTLLGGTRPGAEHTARVIVREACGSPLLVQELVRSHSHDASAPGLVDVTLRRMVERRLAELPPGARRLAEVVAVVGRPLPVATLATAAGLQGDVPEAFALLQARGLARTGFREDREVAEPLHDRIRETVVDLLSPPMLREHHAHLAAVLAATPGSSFEALAMHTLSAGQSAEAARFAEQAAQHAASKLAFDETSRLLRVAIDATPRGADAHRLRLRLAETLVLAGHASDAADEYATAARGATAIERVELERLAAEQLLMSGRLDEGKVVLRRVLAALRVVAPRSAIGATLLLLFYRLWLRIVGLQVRDRDASDVASEDRVRIDTLGSVTICLSAVDPILGACMQARLLLVAMDRGDRTQVLKGLCAAIIHGAIAGRASAQERRMVELANGLAARIGPAVDLPMLQTKALVLYMRGHYAAALEKFDAASREAPGGWGTTNSRLFAIYCCFYMGKLRDTVRRAPRLLRDVEERGDVYTSVCLRSTVMVDIALAADDVEAAGRHLKEAMARWTHSGFHVQHWNAMWSEIKIALYAGDGARARARLERDARALRKSRLLHSQVIRGFTTYMRACCAVASIDAAPALRDARIAETRVMARRLSREGSAWGPALAAIVGALAAQAAGERETAVATLREALALSEDANLGLHACAVRHQLGTAIAGDEGRALVAQAEREMTTEGVRSPARIAALWVPGRWS